MAKFWFKKNNLYRDSTKSCLLYVVNVILKKRHAKKREKVTEAFLSLALPPPLKVDADDDGRVGIWKAPLPDGTVELESVLTRQTYERRPA